MKTRLNSRRWTDVDVARLRALAEAGASANRAAIALNRQTRAMQKAADANGFSFVNTRQAKAAIRKLDENDQHQ
jgi:orotate phosphoribosyltransferase